MSLTTYKMAGLTMMAVGVFLVLFGAHAPRAPFAALPVCLVVGGLVLLLVGLVLHVAVKDDEG